MPSAEALSRSRDLKEQLKELNSESAQEIIFRDTSPSKRRVQLYSLVDGEPLLISSVIAERALEKRRPDGSFMFTIRPEEAPEYKQGAVKCFLHPESNERVSGVLDEVGLSGITCDAASLASVYSKRIHAQHRHHQQWDAYQEYVTEQKQQAQDQRQQAQIEATLSLARQASGVPEPVTTPENFNCDICDWVPREGIQRPAQAFAMHRNTHKEVPDALTE